MNVRRTGKIWLRRAFTRQILLAVVLGGTLLLGAVSAVYAGAVNVSGADKLAIHGYDAVAYFTDGRAVAGSKEFSQEYGGAVYLFASSEHREAFAADPAKYAPQYGGFCAYAVAKGSTADIDPDAWTVKDGKLYLNYSKTVRLLWRQDIDGNIAKADANWPKIMSQ